MNRADALQNIARVANLRNRIIESNFVAFVDGTVIMKKEGTDKRVVEPVSFLTDDTCRRCHNILTIEDRGWNCKQCQLEMRMN